MHRQGCFNRCFGIREAPEGMAKEEQAQHGKGVFGGSEFGICSKLVGGCPKAGFEFLELVSCHGCENIKVLPWQLNDFKSIQC
jgi:hypothetical protein